MLAYIKISGLNFAVVKPCRSTA